jgi:hypothetical protein
MQPKIPAWQRREDLFLVPAGGWLLTGVALLSVFLAGGRPLWAQGFLALGIGLLWLIWTPKKLPAKPVVFMLALLALAPLAAYLPAGWLAMPEWRKGLLQYPALLASGFVTPQPWLTFHVWLLWLCGVALAAWCSCQDWDHYHRAALARMYAGVDQDVKESGQAYDLRMQVLQNIIAGSPDAQEKLQNDPAFRARVEKRAKQLGFQMQQRENAIIGRLGA